MISSIFGKTKPVNFIILLGFILFFYPIVHSYLLLRDFSDLNILEEVGVLAVLLFCVLIMDFIVKRNKLTGTNSFAILFFTLLLVAFPESLGDSNAILCTFFLLLSTRRILSIKSLREIKLKIFDASIWILVASLFYDWAILYLILVMAAIYIYEPKNIRNWLVLLSAGVCFIIILVGFLTLFDNLDFIFDHYNFYLDFRVILPIQIASSIKIILYLILTVVLSVWAFLKLGKAGVGRIIMIRLVVLSFILGLLVNLLVIPNKSYAIMITFFPSVILIANYVESIKREKFREILLIVSITLPIIGFIGRLLISH